ncbi:MAG: hypothetical protein EBW81_09000, partial [Gammaproteobacteria bacterium]|nr:hypothetical protein [Gammaproteobacteria bacterium]
LTTEFNIEGNPIPEFKELVLSIQPAQVTLVPDAEEAITSNAGWDTLKHKTFLKETIAEFKAAGIRTSIFVDPVIEMVEGAKEVGTDRIELYTEAYAKNYQQSPEKAIKPYILAAEKAVALNLGINAGHDLSLENIQYFAQHIPQLLEVSGVGSARLLQGLDVPVILDQPHVGEHLQDHLGINYYYRANRPTLNNTLGSWPGRILAGIRYLATRSGPLALSVNQIGGLTRSSPSAPLIDTQIYCNPVSYEPLPGNERKLTQPHRYPGFILSFNPCRPTSEGSIHITSNDPAQAPRIITNYLSNQNDLDEVIAMARLIGRMQETQAIKAILSAPPDLNLSTMTDEELLLDFRERSGTVYHPCGTCRMGNDAATSVVDTDLRVHGLEGLRVVDASVFPNITSANTNAPTIMVAHEAARRILAT